MATARHRAADASAARAVPRRTRSSGVLREIVAGQRRRPSSGAGTASPTSRRSPSTRSGCRSRSYEDLEPYIAAAMDGQPNQLTRQRAGAVHHDERDDRGAQVHPDDGGRARRQAARSRLWVSALFHDHPRRRGGRVLSMVSPEIESHAPNGMPCGAESGHCLPHDARRGALDVLHAVRGVHDRRLRSQVLHAAAHRGRPGHQRASSPPTPARSSCSPSGWRSTPSRSSGTCGTARCARRRGARRRSAASLSLRPDPARARQLERAAAAGGGGVLRPGLAWPNLAAIGCWKGGTRRRPTWPSSMRYFPPAPPVRDLGYLATEIRGSVPLTRRGRRRGRCQSAPTCWSSTRPTTSAPPAGPSLPHRRAARGRATLLRLRHHRVGPVPLRHERHRRGRRPVRADAAHPLRPEGQGRRLVHRREAVRGPGHRGRRGRASRPPRAGTTFIAAVAELVDDGRPAAGRSSSSSTSDVAERTVLVDRLDAALGRAQQRVPGQAGVGPVRTAGRPRGAAAASSTGTAAGWWRRPRRRPVQDPAADERTCAFAAEFEAERELVTLRA